MTSLFFSHFGSLEASGLSCDVWRREGIFHWTRLAGALAVADSGRKARQSALEMKTARATGATSAQKAHQKPPETRNPPRSQPLKGMGTAEAGGHDHSFTKAKKRNETR